MTKKKKNSQEEELGEKKTVVKAVFSGERVITENSDNARELYNQSRYGSILDNGKVQLSLLEAHYLLEKGRLDVLDGRNKQINFENFLKKAKKLEPNFSYTSNKNEIWLTQDELGQLIKKLDI